MKQWGQARTGGTQRRLWHSELCTDPGMAVKSVKSMAGEKEVAKDYEKAV